jgi:hypothetical protein
MVVWNFQTCKIQISVVLRYVQMKQHFVGNMLLMMFSTSISITGNTHQRRAV